MPFNPPSYVIKAAEEGLKDLNRYADEVDICDLRGLISEYNDVSKERVVIGPGSDLLLRDVISTFSRDRRIVVPDPSFFPTIQSAKQFSERLIKVRLSPPEFEFDTSFLSEDSDDRHLFIIDNPNNPTGNLILDDDTVQDLLDSENNLVVIDEAYYEFSGVTYSDLIEDYSNLAITRSMDKAFSLAGARLGYMLAGDRFLSEFSSFLTFPSRMSVLAGIEALKKPNYSQKNIKKVLNEKNRVKRRLEDLGFKVYSTESNFLLIESEIPNLPRKLENKGVLILDLSEHWLSKYSRITIGTKNENNILIKKMKEIKQEK